MFAAPRTVIKDVYGIDVGAEFDVVGEASSGEETVAVVGEVPLTRLFHAIPAFPTRSEVWLYLLEELGIAGPCYRT